MDKSYSLTYCDYRDNLDDHDELIQAIVNTENGIDLLYEESIDWNMDQQEGESVHAIMKELMTEEELEKLTDREREEIETAIYDRRDDDYCKEVLDNTSPRYFYYDLNEYIGDEDDLKTFCEKYKIDYENALKIYRESFDCGQAVIFFWNNPTEMLQNGNTISFDADCELAFISRSLGSGFSGALKQKLSLPFVRENLNDDKGASGYSYTDEVCGMIGGAMGSALIHDTKEVLPEITVNENAQSFARQEAEYQATYKAGKCTLGDTKYSRHRNHKYVNEFPCGTHCTDCGQFWID